MSLYFTFRCTQESWSEVNGYIESNLVSQYCPVSNNSNNHLLGLITHETMHVSAHTCPGSSEKEQILLPLVSLPPCVKNEQGLWRQTQDRRENPKGHSLPTIATPFPFSLYSSSGWPLTLSVESLRQVVGMECSVDVQHKVSTGRERERDRASKCTTSKCIYPLKLKWSQSPLKVLVDGFKAMILMGPSQENFLTKKNKALHMYAV